MSRLGSLSLAIVVMVSGCATASRDRATKACGVSFRYPAVWTVRSISRQDPECDLVVSPRNLAALMAAERDPAVMEGRVVDRYSIRISIVSGVPTSEQDIDDCDSEEEDFRDAAPVSMNGWKGCSDDERVGRAYFENDEGYCCQSHQPLTLMSKHGVRVSILGSVEGMDVYNLVRSTLSLE